MVIQGFNLKFEVMVMLLAFYCGKLGLNTVDAATIAVKYSCWLDAAIIVVVKISRFDFAAKTLKP